MAIDWADSGEEKAERGTEEHRDLNGRRQKEEGYGILGEVGIFQASILEVEDGLFFYVFFSLSLQWLLQPLTLITWRQI